MKKYFLLSLIFLLASATQAQVVPQMKSCDDGTHLSLYVPGILVKATAKIAKIEDDNALLKSVNGVKVHIREGIYYENKSDLRRFVRRNQRRYDPVMVINTEGAKVTLHSKSRRGKIRGVFLTVDEPGTFIAIKVKGKFDLEKMMSMTEKVKILQK